MTELPRITRFGVGKAARREAMRRAYAMRDEGIAAMALFKLEYGGWVVVVDGRIHQKAPPPRPR
jgi:hypothetical protein